jgi:hypothetical protein
LTEYSHFLGVKEDGPFLRGTTMDEDQKGCLLVGGVFFILSFFVMTAIIVLLVVLPSTHPQKASGGIESQIAVFQFLLTCTIELVKYLLTPFAPFFLAIAAPQK